MHIDGTPYPSIEHYLDEERSRVAQLTYPVTNTTYSHLITSALQRDAGIYRHIADEHLHSAVTVPFQHGSLIIGMPWLDIKTATYTGHAVRYQGEQPIPSAQDVSAYLQPILQREEDRARQDYRSAQQRQQRKNLGRPTFLSAGTRHAP